MRDLLARFTLGCAAVLFVVAILPPHGMVLGDPPPPVMVKVFCLRITDIRKVADPEGDKFRFEFEFLNWTDQATFGAEMMFTDSNPGNVFITSAGIDSNGRPLVVEDVNGDTFTTDPPALSDLEDINGDGILDANENNGVVDGGFFDNANGRLDNDPIPGNANPANDWAVASQTSTKVTWQAGKAGTAIANRDLLEPLIEPRKLIEGWNQGDGPTTIDSEGNVTPAEAIDDGNNVLDGFTLTVDDLDDGDTFALNWFLVDALGDPIGTEGAGNVMGFGTLSIARADDGNFPDPLFPGNTGFFQGNRDFFDSVYAVPKDVQFGTEFGPSLTAPFQNPADNTLGAGINTLSVGGITSLPEVAEAPLAAVDSSGSDAAVLAAVVVTVMAGVIALGGAAWYARRRWLR